MEIPGYKGDPLPKILFILLSENQTRLSITCGSVCPFSAIIRL